MKSLTLLKISLLILFFFVSPRLVKAQYCAPTISNTGIYLSRINFQTDQYIVGGQAYNTGSTSYSQTVGTTSGTVSRYFGGSVYYSIANPNSIVKNFDFRIYADWNSNGQFSDSTEGVFSSAGTVPGISSTTTATNINPLLNVPPGNIRLRFAVSSTGTSACGTYVGEAEDYIITIPVNNAPVLNTLANTYINSILSTETNSNGVSLSEFIQSSQPGNQLIADADDRASGFYNLVPRGIAIFNKSPAGGTWQFKVGNGSWTDFQSLSSGNALLLLSDAAYATYQPHTRIRFVPTGPGSPFLNFRAWDGTSGFNGSYGNIVASGGAAAFSTDSSSAFMSVISPAGFDNKIYISTLNNNIYKADFNKSAHKLNNPELVLDSSDDYYSVDLMVYDVTNKMYWQSGMNQQKIASSNADGSSLNTSLISGLNYCTGVTEANNKIYYWNWAPDYSSADIYSANADGTNIIKIRSGAGISDTKYMKFYNNKLYFEYFDGDAWNISSINTDGSGENNFYSTGNTITGLAVANDTAYWSESDGSIFRRSIAGGAVASLVIPGGQIIGNIAVDPSSPRVYYIANDPTDYNYTLIRSVPTSGGASVTVATVSGLATSLSVDKNLSVLPVSLLKFEGTYQPQNHVSVIRWTTSTEQQAFLYVLQRSVDGVTFTDITTVTARNSSLEIKYEYDDHVQNIDFPVLYYRLKQIDKDGKFNLSKVIILNKNHEAILTRIIPNPGQSDFVVQLGNIPLKPVVINIYGENGSLVYADKISSREYKLNMAKYASGLYYIQLSFDDGTQKQLQLIKQ